MAAPTTDPIELLEALTELEGLVSAGRVGMDQVAASASEFAGTGSTRLQLHIT